jgi:signal peptidase II
LAALLVAFAIGLTADLVTKYVAFDRIDAVEVHTADGVQLHADSVEFLPGWLHFTRVVNYGAALGVGEGMRWFFIGVSVAAVGLLLYFFSQSGRRLFYQIVLGLLLAGVVGNMYDRLFHGHVRDMIHTFPGRRWSDVLSFLPEARVFPWVFNVADIWLCVGVAIIFVYGLFAKDDPPTATA